MKKASYYIILLVLLTFVVRLVIVFNTYVISSDGPFYLKVAKLFAEGDYKSALLKQTFHPLYPFLIAMAYKFVGGWEWAGLLVSIFFSSLGVIPIYFIGKRYFSNQIVIISCILYSFHPYSAQLSASILTTGIFIGIFLFTLWTIIIALETYRYRYFFISGLLSFIMYLVRPDGMVFVFLSLVFLVLSLLLSIISILINPDKLLLKNKLILRCFFYVLMLFIPNKPPVKKIILSILMLLVPWMLLMPPYIYSVKLVTGKINVTGKASIKQMLGLGSKEADSIDTSEITPGTGAKKIVIVKYLNALYLLFVDFIKGANVILFLLFLIGTIYYFKEENHPLTKSFFIWLVLVSFLIVFFRYAVLSDRMSRRYTVPLFMIVILWAGKGLYVITERILLSIKKIPANNLRYKDKFYYSLGVFIIIVMSFFTFQPIGKSKITEKATGQLLNKYHSIKNMATPKIPRIITMSSRIAYYAGGEAVMPEELGKNYNKLTDIILGQGIDYLVLDSQILRKFPYLENEICQCKRKQLSVELISPYFEVVDGMNVEFYKTYRFFIDLENK